MFTLFKSGKLALSMGLVIIVLFVALLSAAAGPSFTVSAAPLATTSTVGLGTAAFFAVLAGSAVNDTTPSSVTGAVGLSPASGAFIFLTCPEVTGAIFSVNPAGPLPCRKIKPGLLTIAKNNLTTAYNDAAGRGAGTIATELGGQTLLDGVYNSASTTFEIAAAKTLTLDGGGNPDSVWIFKMGSTAASLVTFANSTVKLINGAQSCNVFWQVGGSATLGTNSSFVGTIMADQSITDDGGSTVDGRFLASIAAVTLNNTTISLPVCAASTPTNTPANTPTNTPPPTNTQTPVRNTPTRTPKPGGGGGGNQATSVPIATQLPAATPTQVVTTLLPTTGGAPDISLIWFALGGAGAALGGLSLWRKRR